MVRLSFSIVFTVKMICKRFKRFFYWGEDVIKLNRSGNGNKDPLKNKTGKVHIYYSYYVDNDVFKNKNKYKFEEN